jgi:hypothetical protein
MNLRLWLGNINVNHCIQILTALTRSAQASYGIGQWMGGSLGLSGTAFLAFVLLIK